MQYFDQKKASHDFFIMKNPFLYLAKKLKNSKKQTRYFEKLFPYFYEPLKASYIFRWFMKPLLDVNIYNIFITYYIWNAYKHEACMYCVNLNRVPRRTATPYESRRKAHFFSSVHF